MGQQENIAALTKAAQAINTGDFETLRQGYTANVKEHDPAPGQKQGAQGYVDYFRAVRAAFPDFHMSAEHVIANDDEVALAYTMTGTHKGVFMGVPPTGKKFHARGLLIARFEGGKLAERWGSSDELGILKQIGAAVAPASQAKKAA